MYLNNLRTFIKVRNYFHLFLFTCIYYLGFTILTYTTQSKHLNLNANWKEINTPLYRTIFWDDKDTKEWSSIAQHLNLILQTIHPSTFRNITNQNEDLFFQNSPIIIDKEPLDFNGTAYPFGHYRSLIFPNYDHFLLSTSVNPYLIMATHELRHLAQFQLIYQANNWNLFLYYLNGETVGFGNGTKQLPIWYLEGEATLWETLLTDGGRGRIPFFDLRLRTRLLEEENPSQDWYGIPYDGGLPKISDYTFGYYLITYLMTHYGENVMRKIIKNSGNYLGLFPTISSSIEKQTSKELDKHYTDMKKELVALWQEQQRAHLPFNNITPIIINPDNWWVSYDTPQLDGNGNLYYIKSVHGDNYSPSLRVVNNNALLKVENMRVENMKVGDGYYSDILDDQSDEVIEPFHGSVSFNNRRGYSVGSNLLVWVERKSSLSGRSPSQPMTFTSLQSGKVYLQQLDEGDVTSIGDRDSRYQSAFVSSDDTVLVTINRSKRQFNELGIWQIKDSGNSVELINSHVFYRSIHGLDIDTKNTRIVLSLGGPLGFGHENNNPNNNPKEPSKSSSPGNQLLLLNYQNSEIKQYSLTPFTLSERFSNPVFYHDWIIYHSDYSGIDNLYALNLNSKNRYRITSRPFGAFKPMVRETSSGGELYFTDYQLYGFNLVKANYKIPPPESESEKNIPKEWKLFSAITPHTTSYFEKLKKQMNIPTYRMNDIIADNQHLINKYDVTDYQMSSTELLPYDWAFFNLLDAYDISSSEIYFVNLKLNFADVFSEYIFSLGYKLGTYSRPNYITDNTIIQHNFNLGVRYLGWYPILSLDLDYKFYYDKPNLYYSYNPDPDHPYIHSLYITPGIEFPFNLSTDLQFTRLSIGYFPRLRLSLNDNKDLIDYVLHNINLRLNFGKNSWSGMWDNHFDIFHTEETEKVTLLFLTGFDFELPGFGRMDRFRWRNRAEWKLKRDSSSISFNYKPVAFSKKLHYEDLSFFHRFTYVPLVLENRIIPFVSTYSLDQYFEISLIYEHLMTGTKIDSFDDFNHYHYGGAGLAFKLKKYGSTYFKAGGEIFYQPKNDNNIEWTLFIKVNL